MSASNRGENRNKVGVKPLNGMCTTSFQRMKNKNLENGADIFLKDERA